jgi:hypothetical protein
MWIVFVERELVREKLNKGDVELRGRAEDLISNRYYLLLGGRELG